MAFIAKSLVCLLALTTVFGHGVGGKHGNYGRRPGHGSKYGLVRPGLGGGLHSGGYGGLTGGVRPGFGGGVRPGYAGGILPGVGGVRPGFGGGISPGLGGGVRPGLGGGVRPGLGGGVLPGVGGITSGLGLGGGVVPGAGVLGGAGHGRSSVLVINKLNGGSYDPYSIWAADCNNGNYGYPRWMTGIWDDLNNFKDLDKVKCSGSSYGVTLNLKDNIVLDLHAGKHGLSQCPENYVITALWDKNFGFPHPSKAKCTRVTYGYLDNYDILTLYTENKFGGDYSNYGPWNVECPPEYAMVGIKKEYDRTIAINCAPLQRHH